MGGLSIVLLVVQIVAAIAIICLVLLQHGKGADMGAAFGSGSAGSIFGSSGSANFLSRMTAVAAALFFISTLGMTFVGYKSLDGNGSSSVLDKAAAMTGSDTSVIKEKEPTQTENTNQVPAL